MKRRYTIMLLTLAAILGIQAVQVCAAPDSQSADKELVASFDGEMLPAFIEKTDAGWFVINQEYGKQEYIFAVGRVAEALDQNAENTSESVDRNKADLPEAFITKYEGSGQIMNLSADGDYAVWGEYGDDGVSIRLYDAGSDAVSTVVTMPESDYDIQQAKVYTKGGKVFYQLVDNENSTFQVMCYDIESGETAAMAEEAFSYFGGCFTLRDQTLIYQNVGENGENVLSFLDITTSETEQMPLPEGVDVLYDADIEGDTIAAYYYDMREGKEVWNQNDNIAVFTRDEKEVIPVFSFPVTDTGATYYAYRDNIELFGDNVLWIYQQNVSGNIVDHYQLTIYDFKNHVPEEEPAAFAFMTDEEKLYYLAFQDGIMKVNLYERRK